MILPTKSLAISYNQYSFFAKSFDEIDSSSPFFLGKPMSTMFVGVMVRGYQVGRNNTYEVTS